MTSVPGFFKVMSVTFAISVLVGCGGTADITGTSQSAATATQDPDAPAAALSPGNTTPSVGRGGAVPGPQIDGQPLTSVRIGETYEFQPSASDPNGEALHFEVTNLPSWADFDASTGRLSGTPSDGDVGTFPGIVVSVANSTRSSSLAPFTLTVTQIATGTATVSWLPPLKNTDGSTLLDLHGFQIHFGRSAASLNQVVKISNASISRHVIDNLSSGAWYFAVSAINSRGNQSALSGVRSKVVD